MDFSADVHIRLDQKDKERYNLLCVTFYLWRGGRVVEGNGLENRRSREATVGSNPTLSANIFCVKTYF
jgi:hypothetical protein